jgi:nuclear pore complex protein Nup93
LLNFWSDSYQSFGYIRGSYFTLLTDALNRNYLLAQARVDASALSNSIAHLNTSSTFSPLQPLQDTDVVGFLRHAHEQNLISTIEEGRKETQEQFYRMLEERSRKDWEAKKKRVFEELSGRTSGENRAIAELRKSFHGKSSVVSSSLSLLPHLILFTGRCSA